MAALQHQIAQVVLSLRVALARGLGLLDGATVGAGIARRIAAGKPRPRVFRIHSAQPFPLTPIEEEAAAWAGGPPIDSIGIKATHEDCITAAFRETTDFREHGGAGEWQAEFGLDPAGIDRAARELLEG